MVVLFHNDWADRDELGFVHEVQHDSPYVALLLETKCGSLLRHVEYETELMKAYEQRLWL
jgi:hypothetical protein